MSIYLHPSPLNTMDVISQVRRFYSDKGARTDGSEEE
jgi:hypothetical protein